MILSRNAALLTIALAILGLAAAVWPPSGATPPWTWPTAGHADQAPQAAATTFDYSARFEEEVRKVGQISPQEFARRHPGKAVYLPRLSWDPTTARFWDRLTVDPQSYRPAPGKP